MMVNRIHRPHVAATAAAAAAPSFGTGILSAIVAIAPQSQTD